MRHRIGIANFGGSWSAFAFDVPGCATNAASRSDLLVIAPVAVAEHVAWLGSVVSGAEQVEIDVVEEICAADEAAVEGEFCFADDLRPVTTRDIEEAIAVMERSRACLLASVRAVPDAILDWRPPRSAMSHVDEWKPVPATVREILGDIAAAEGYYRAGLRDGRDENAIDSRARDLELQRQLLVQALRALTAGERARRFEPIRPWQSAPEHWTARKVIRRVISHERFHTAEIRQRLSWLLVGVPNFTRWNEEMP
jgi:hypothetical protein